MTAAGEDNNGCPRRLFFWRQINRDRRIVNIFYPIIFCLFGIIAPAFETRCAVGPEWDLAGSVLGIGQDGVQKGGTQNCGYGNRKKYVHGLNRFAAISYGLLGEKCRPELKLQRRNKS